MSSQVERASASDDDVPNLVVRDTRFHKSLLPLTRPIRPARHPGMLSQVSTGASRASLLPRLILSASNPTRLVLRSSPSCAVQQRSLCLRCGLLGPTTTYETRPKRPLRSSARLKVRSYATVTEAGAQLPKDIAVLGGGLTGLTTAYYLTRFNPDANITVYEAADRLGGWVDTEQVDVKTQDGENATISFERGARTIAPQSSMGRWEDFVFFDLIDQLGLLRHPDTAPYAVPKFDPVLTKRYVYYPNYLVEMPRPSSPDTSPLSKIAWWVRTVPKMLTEPVFKGLPKTVWSVATKDFEAANKFKTARAEDRNGTARYAVADHTDVSVGDFFSRHLGNPDLVNNLMSALFHGIWGGDIWKLSVTETTMQNFFFQSQYFGTSLIPVKEHDYSSGKDIFTRNPAVVEIMEQYGPNCSYIGFHNGFSALPEALASALKSNPKVTIRTGKPVNAIRYDTAEGKAVVESSNEKHKYDKVISSLYSGALAKLTGDSLPSLKKSTAVTIQIVNLWYPNPALTAHTPGFGYLIPQSVAADKNPHAALGVIFDSDRDAAAGTQEYAAAPGTKLTVMLGGHYWDYLDPESWPTAEEATAMAIDTVERQLGIPSTEPVYTSTKICRECIPQHLVGHRARMAQAHTELYNDFRGTLAVVGGSYTSPGVLPTLKAARDMALQVAGQGYKDETKGIDSQLTHVGETGLARFHGKNEKFRWVPRAILPFRGQMKHRAFNWKS